MNLGSLDLESDAVPIESPRHPGKTFCRNSVNVINYLVGRLGSTVAAVLRGKKQHFAYAKFLLGTIKNTQYKNN